MRTTMKYSTILLSVAAATLLSSCTFIGINKNFEGELDKHIHFTINDSGETTTRTYDLTGFNAIKTNVPCDLNYIIGEEAVSISATENLINTLTVKVEDGVLIIENPETRIRNQRNTRISVTAPTLTGVTVNGATDFTADRIVTEEDFKCRINGAADVNIRSLEAVNASLRVDGAGDLDVRGINCNTLKVEINGAGDVTLSGKAASTRIEVNGAGDIDTESLDCADFQKVVNGRVRSR